MIFNMLVSKKLDNFTEWTPREILLRFSSFGVGGRNYNLSK